MLSSNIISLAFATLLPGALAVPTGLFASVTGMVDAGVADVSVAACIALGEGSCILSTASQRAHARRAQEASEAMEKRDILASALVCVTIGDPSCSVSSASQRARARRTAAAEAITRRQVSTSACVSIGDPNCASASQRARARRTVVAEEEHAKRQVSGAACISVGDPGCSTSSASQRARAIRTEVIDDVLARRAEVAAASEGTCSPDDADCPSAAPSDFPATHAARSLSEEQKALLCPKGEKMCPSGLAGFECVGEFEMCQSN